MIIRPDQTGSVGTSSTATPTECGNCGTTDNLFLHNVRYRSAGSYRRVCTSCVLRLHPQHFCPSCFTVYPSAPPPLSADYLSCTKCYSFSHIHCLGSADRSPYTCPLCINPSYPIFILKKAKDFGGNSGGVSGDDMNDGECRVIDKKAAKILLAAAKIAAALMTKNAAEANANAEKRAREAAASRKRARDALDHLAYLVAKEKFARKEVALTGFQGSSSGGSLVGRRDYNNGAGSGNMSQMVKAVSRNVSNGVAGRVNGSAEALTALAAVELRDGERRKEDSQIGKLQLGVRLNDLVPMDVDVEHVRINQEYPANGLIAHGGSTHELIGQENPGHCHLGHGTIVIAGSLQGNVENHGLEVERGSNDQVMAVTLEDHSVS